MIRFATLQASCLVFTEQLLQTMRIVFKCFAIGNTCQFPTCNWRGIIVMVVTNVARSALKCKWCFGPGSMVLTHFDHVLCFYFRRGEQNGCLQLEEIQIMIMIMIMIIIMIMIMIRIRQTTCQTTDIVWNWILSRFACWLRFAWRVSAYYHFLVPWMNPVMELARSGHSRFNMFAKKWRFELQG